MTTISYSIYAMMSREATGNTSNCSVMILGEFSLHHSTSNHVTTTSLVTIRSITQAMDFTMEMLIAVAVVA
jgi:hypothetical protein